LIQVDWTSTFSLSKDSKRLIRREVIHSLIRLAVAIHSIRSLIDEAILEHLLLPVVLVVVVANVYINTVDIVAEVVVASNGPLASITLDETAEILDGHVDAAVVELIAPASAGVPLHPAEWHGLTLAASSLAIRSKEMDADNSLSRSIV
jgi:hypothetical protein